MPFRCTHPDEAAHSTVANAHVMQSDARRRLGCDILWYVRTWACLERWHAIDLAFTRRKDSDGCHAKALRFVHITLEGAVIIER